MKSRCSQLCEPGVEGCRFVPPLGMLEDVMHRLRLHATCGRPAQQLNPATAWHRRARQQATMAAQPSSLSLTEDHYELDDRFTGLEDTQGFFTVAGFGSLLSERSARYGACLPTETCLGRAGVVPHDLSFMCMQVHIP